MQFYRDETGTMTPLPKPTIDTGMGLERMAAVLQGKTTNYDSDLFTPIIEHIAAPGRQDTTTTFQADDVSMRVIADHARATTFLVADGVLPSNEGRGYVLRRIMRRAIRYGRALGLTSPSSPSVCALVTEQMQAAYPHLNDTRDLLAKVVTNEEQRFGETLDHGLNQLDQEIRHLQKARGDQAVIPGEFIFKLYDTYGFPVDIVRDIAIEKGIAFDEPGFARAMDQQREQSRKSWKGSDVDHLRGRPDRTGPPGQEGPGSSATLPPAGWPRWRASSTRPDSWSTRPRPARPCASCARRHPFMPNPAARSATRARSPGRAAVLSSKRPWPRWRG